MSVHFFDAGHRGWIIDACNEYMQNESFVDVKLVCKNKNTVYTHKLILTTASPFLKSLLQNTNCSEDMVTLYLPDFDHNIVTFLLTFLYVGVMKLNREELKEFRDLCCGLGMSFPNAEVEKLKLPPCQSELNDLSPGEFTTANIWCTEEVNLQEKSPVVPEIHDDSSIDVLYEDIDVAIMEPTVHIGGNSQGIIESKFSCPFSQRTHNKGLSFQENISKFESIIPSTRPSHSKKGGSNEQRISKPDTSFHSTQPSYKEREYSDVRGINRPGTSFRSTQTLDSERGFSNEQTTSKPNNSFHSTQPIHDRREISELGASSQSPQIASSKKVLNAKVSGHNEESLKTNLQCDLSGTIAEKFKSCRTPYNVPLSEREINFKNNQHSLEFTQSCSQRVINKSKPVTDKSKPVTDKSKPVTDNLTMETCSLKTNLMPMVLSEQASCIKQNTMQSTLPSTSTKSNAVNTKHKRKSSDKTRPVIKRKTF